MRFFRFLSSLKFAVINLLALAAICAVATFMESYYSAYFARIFVYHSVWMKIILSSLCVNLTAVLVDRWPWKKRHLSFVSAHFGILILIAGAFLTEKKGVDGSLRLARGEEGRSIVLPSKILAVYSSFDGKNQSEIYKDEPIFLMKKPSVKNPYKIPLGTQQMEVIDFYPYALSKEVFLKKPDSKGWAIRFLISGESVRVSDWIYKKPAAQVVQKKIGPARIVIHLGDSTPEQKNELVFSEMSRRGLKYRLVSQGHIRSEGFLKKGEKIPTGWMDLKFHLLDFYKAQKVYQFTPVKKETENTVEAIQVRFQDQERWMSLNSFLSFYREKSVYMLAYMNRRKSIGMRVKLLDFKVMRYPASRKAMEYESVIQVDEAPPVKVSMNEPLKYKGWTFYQSGFEEDEEGRAVASIFSVNRDPGRLVKYFGSFLIVIGVFALLFLRRKKLFK